MKRRIAIVALFVVVPLLSLVSAVPASSAPLLQITDTPLPTETVAPTLTPYLPIYCPTGTSMIPSPEPFYTPTGITPTVTGTVFPTITATFTPLPTVTSTLPSGSIVMTDSEGAISCSSYLNGLRCEFDANKGYSGYGEVHADIEFDKVGVTTAYLHVEAIATGINNYRHFGIDKDGGLAGGGTWSVMDGPYNRVGTGEWASFDATYDGVWGFASGGFISGEAGRFQGVMYILPVPYVPATPVPTATPNCQTLNSGEVIPSDPIAWMNLPSKSLHGCYVILNPITVPLPSLSWSPFSMPDSFSLPGWQICVWLLTFSAYFAGVEWSGVLGVIVTAFATVSIYTVLRDQ